MQPFAFGSFCLKSSYLICEIGNLLLRQQIRQAVIEFFEISISNCISRNIVTKFRIIAEYNDIDAQILHCRKIFK